MKQNKKMLITTLLGFIFLVSTCVNSVHACTGIRLTATDKGVVYGRTMEWGEFNMNSRITIIPRGYSFTGLTPDGLNGKKWKAKYGVLGLDILETDYLTDGMNEKGLAAGLFYHPGFACYPSYEKDKADNSISSADVTNYILTQFATLYEVRQGMSKVRVIGATDAKTGVSIYAHWMVTSPEGESIVIEFTDGRMKIFDDPLGVITNAPTFDWHMINLRNYINLSAVAIPDKKIDELNFAPLGVGSGMIGLPGDFTPPSRFVRAVAWTQTARPTNTPSETVFEVFRILDNFNVPLDASKDLGDSHINTKGMLSATEWTTAWDLSNRVLYYHTQYNRRVRSFDLKELNFSNLGNDIIHLPLDKIKEQDIEHISLKK